MTSLLQHSARKVDIDGVVEDFWVRSEDGVITETGSGQRRPSAELSVDLRGDTLAPGFIDLHMHGGGGASVDDGEQAIRTALRTHRRHGTTRAVLSLVSQPVEDLENSLRRIASLYGPDSEVLGAHLEGPFLAPSRRGAHAEHALITPTAEVVNRLLEAAGGSLRQVTLAPEREGAAEALTLLRGAGVAVALGHTETDYEMARDTFRRGASLLTHTFNAMPGLHHRTPGPIPAALEQEHVTLELILDGVHVHPAAARTLIAAAPGRVALITDAMAAAGFSDGDYALGELEVEVREGIARVRGTETIAGSTLTLDTALRNAMALGLPETEAIAALTAVPAAALELDHRLGRLEPGYASDAVRLDAGHHVIQTWGPEQLISDETL